MPDRTAFRSELEPTVIHIESWIPAALFAVLAFALTTPSGGDAAAGGTPAQEDGTLILLAPGASGTGLPDPWHLIELPGRSATHYASGTATGRTAIAALADDAAAGVFRRVDLELDRHRWLEWEWQIERTLPGPVRERSHDDYPARLFVVFSDEGWPAERELTLDDLAELPTLCYVWAPERTVEGSIYVSPYRDNVRTVPLRSGDARAGSWVLERRDLRADFERAFEGRARRVIALGLMTDSDDTGTIARAWYGRIRALPDEPAARRRESAPSQFSALSDPSSGTSRTAHRPELLSER